MKCSHPDCARDAQCSFYGSGKRGRPAADAVGGIPYCVTHYKRAERGSDMDKPVKPKGKGPYRRAVDDCADIAAFHGYEDLAALLRKLNAT